MTNVYQKSEVKNQKSALFEIFDHFVRFPQLHSCEGMTNVYQKSKVKNQKVPSCVGRKRPRKLSFAVWTGFHEEPAVHIETEPFHVTFLQYESKSIVTHSISIQQKKEHEKGYRKKWFCYSNFAVSLHFQEYLKGIVIAVDFIALDKVTIIQHGINLTRF